MGARDDELQIAGLALPSQVVATLFGALAPAPRLTVSEWADTHRRLPTKGAAEPGAWRTSRTPFLRGIMDCLSADHPAQRVVFMKPVQIGGTEVGNNWIGYFMDTQKAPMMVVQPTLELAERWSKQRLAAMIEDCPSLREKVRPARERDSGNTTLLKELPGGVLIVAGANSAAGLRSMPARWLFLDEIDAYPHELEEEGNPIDLAEGRTTTFGRRAKVFLCSTPTIESLSRIHKEYLASDMRRYHVPCPYCGALQVLKWENLHWPIGMPQEAVYHCEHCGVGIEEHHKTEMLREEGYGGCAKWIAERPEVFDDRLIAGFHINALYTPVGLGKSWAELARLTDEANRDPAKLKSLTNLRKGEVLADPDEKLDADELKERAGAWRTRTIPIGCLLLTVGVDVQKDRFAVVIVGFGREHRMWIIDYVEIPADPTRDEDWLKLEAYIDQPLLNAFGLPMKPVMRAVDSGYLQDHVLHFTRTRQRRGWMAVKGATQSGRPIVLKPSRVDYTRRGMVVKGGAEQWQVGVDRAKEMLFARLGADRKRSGDDRLCHFPADLDESFYSQFTAEIFDPNKRRWVKIRSRNESLDAVCYAIAAAYQPAVRVQTWREPQWLRLEAVLQPANADLFAVVAPQRAAAPEEREGEAMARKSIEMALPDADINQMRFAALLRARKLQHAQRR